MPRKSTGRFSRQADERVLDMLKMRDEGMKLADIARILGVGRGTVIGACRRVDADDLDAVLP